MAKPEDHEAEEERFQSSSVLQSWVKEFTGHQNFRLLMRAVQRRMPHQATIQDTPHGQHVADGFRQGAATFERTLEGIQYESLGGPAGEPEMKQEIDPELDDTTEQ